MDDVPRQTPIIIVIDDSDDSDGPGAADDPHPPPSRVSAQQGTAPTQGDYVPLRAGGGVGRFVPSRWPYSVVNLRDHFNPDAIRLRSNRHFGMCGCARSCRFDGCMNARLAIFCDRNCCPFRGQCGNGLQESPSLLLLRNTTTGVYAVQARRRIKRGIIIGEYLGVWTLEQRHAVSTGAGNYRLAMRAEVVDNRSMCVCIDAEHLGGMMRFLNHSCNPTARFHEVSNGNRHTVVAVTERAIRSGEEVTVDYGRSLWFTCRCGQPHCQHPP